MIIYSEIKEIVNLYTEIKELISKLTEKTEIDGLIFEGAYFLHGCREVDGHLYNADGRIDRDGLVDDEYYCTQYTGYSEDDHYGTLYFKTDKKGVFAAVPFHV